MRSLYYLQQVKQSILLVCILISPIVCTAAKENFQTIPCDALNQNCNVPLSNSLLKAIVSTSTQLTSLQSTARVTRQNISKKSNPTFTPSKSTTKPTKSSDFDSFSDNLKRAALILAGIAIGLGILRVCLMLCKTRSPNNTTTSRHTAIVRPQVATIEHHQFKPDLPPAYAEAIRNREINGDKLPSYEELPYEQRQEQPNNYNDQFISTQV